MLRDATPATLIAEIFSMLLLPCFQSCLTPHDSCVTPLWATSLREARPCFRDRAARGLSISCSLGPSREEQNTHKLVAGSDAAQSDTSSQSVRFTTCGAAATLVCDVCVCPSHATGVADLLFAIRISSGLVNGVPLQRV